MHRKLFVVIVLLFSQAVSSFADSFDYDQLRSQYFKLKNTDPEIERIDQWQAVLDQYDYASKEKTHYLSDKFYFDFSNLLRELSQSRKDSLLLERSIDQLDFLVEKFASSNLADDALLKKSELLSFSGASQELSHEVLRELVEKYPDTDSAQVAQIKLHNKDQAIVPTLVPQAEDLSNLPVVVLDPGHGGEDFGAQNDFGLFEKDVALAIALDTEKLLIQNKIAKPVLTRRTDVFVALKQRVEIANANNASLFISLHSNASPEKDQQGLTTYVLDNSTDEASRLLAERENKSAGGQEYSDLSFIIGDLIQSSKHPKSALLAESLQRQLLSSAAIRMKNVRNNKLKKAPFFVLVGAQMPCVLLELFFIDHLDDAEFLADPAFRKDLAQGISSGIKIFLEKLGA